MAKRENFKMTTAQRRMRHFSTSFKISKVREIELGQTKVGEVSKEYEVTAVNVYRWIAKFGSMKKKEQRLVVETDSDTKQLIELKKKIAELERIIGQKQIQIDFKEKMIEIAEQMYGVDIKKKFSDKPSGTTGCTESDTPSA
jgi:transposase